MLNIHKKKAMVSLNATSRKGFTFVELVVVIAVLAVLLAVLAPSLLSYVELSRMQKDDSTMDEVVNAVQLAITDSATFDEVYSYCIPNNYVTYTDSSGKYANRTMDEEFWAPDGSGAAVTITFNPENGKYNISEGIVNDMTFGNGSVAEKRTAEGVQQCYLYEMGKSLLFSSVKQTIGDSIKERSATYKNSSYTIFIRFKIVDGTRQADVYGLFNGTNLSEGCPAAIGSNTSSYDEENKPISTTPSGGHQNSKFTNTDLMGGGNLSGDTSKPLPTYRQCKKGHTFDPTNPVLSERCKCLVCYVIEHKFYETGTTLKCERCGYAKEHECNGNPCPLCGAIPFTVTAENREKVGFTGEENENLVIPETFIDTDGQRYRVVAIGGGAFAACKNLSKVTLPNSVSNIGAYAFQNCWNLTSINIPDGVQSVNTHTFSNCYILADINIPQGVTSIGMYAFTNTSIQNITIPESVTNIGNNAFQCCRNLTSINIPDGITSIKNSVFNGCSNLTSINIPDSVTSIEDYAFDGCTSLSSINIPDGVTSIGTAAFYGCTSLVETTIPNSVTSIGTSAFSNCRSLANINLPPKITTIEVGTLYNCSSLTSINIPNGVTKIGNNAFGRCTSLTGELVIPQSVTCFGDSAFYGCSNLTSINIPDGVTSIGKNAFCGCSSLSGKIVIPDGVAVIEDGTFSDCISLTSIDLPHTLSSIGNGAFSGCKSLTSVNIPDGVTSIGNNAFNSCIRLTNKLTIPNSVTSIGQYAFASCSGLTGNIVIPDGVTSIKSNTFAGCTGLKGEVTIPHSVTSIEGSVFFLCSGLTSIKYDGTQSEWIAMPKGSVWNGNTHITIIHCTDGDIA